jgi:hypothetical protein
MRSPWSPADLVDAIDRSLAPGGKKPLLLRWRAVLFGDPYQLAPVPGDADEGRLSPTRPIPVDVGSSDLKVSRQETELRASSRADHHPISQSNEAAESGFNMPNAVRHSNGHRGCTAGQPRPEPRPPDVWMWRAINPPPSATHATAPPASTSPPRSASGSGGEDGRGTDVSESSGGRSFRPMSRRNSGVSAMKAMSLRNDLWW